MAWTKAPVSKKSAVYKTAQRSSNPPKKKAKPGTIKGSEVRPKITYLRNFWAYFGPLKQRYTFAKISN